MSLLFLIGILSRFYKVACYCLILKEKKTFVSSGTEIKDGERLPVATKDMGSCEIYPQTIAHNPNGRFVVVCGDGEYIIYTAMALRNKAFGSAQEFVWAQDSSEYAIREGTTYIKVGMSPLYWKLEWELYWKLLTSKKIQHTSQPSLKWVGNKKYIHNCSTRAKISP